MDELTKDFLYQFLLIVGAVMIGIALTDIKNTSPAPFFFGLIFVFIAIIIKRYKQ